MFYRLPLIAVDALPRGLCCGLLRRRLLQRSGSVVGVLGSDNVPRRLACAVVMAWRALTVAAAIALSGIALAFVASLFCPHPDV